MLAADNKTPGGGLGGQIHHQTEDLLESVIDGFISIDGEWRISYVNSGSERLTGLRKRDMVGRDYWELFPEPAGTGVREACRRALETGVPVEFENFHAPGQRWFHVKASPAAAGGLCVFFADITARKQAESDCAILLEREREARVEAETLNEISRKLAGELDLQKLVQATTDAATALTGASFGAFFYNVAGENGETYRLHTLSGAAPESFDKLELPRDTAVFEPAFRGARVVRSDDIQNDIQGDIQDDPDYVKLAPFFGMSAGHLPVRSYLAVPVAGRAGEALGGLFFGHPEPGVFTERSERMAVGIAAHAAIAIDNARLFAKVEREVERRRKAEELLRQSEQRFRAIVDTTPECVKMIARDGTLLQMNSAGLAMLGAASLEDAVGKCVYELIAPAHRESYRQFNERVCGGERGTLEFEMTGAGGRRLLMETHAAPFRDPDGTIVHLAVSRDITERRIRERATLLLAAIVDSSDDAIISKDLNGVITSWNRSAQRLFGYTAEEATGKPVTILMPPERVGEEPGILARLRRGERVDHFETVRRRKDGTLLDISLTISPVKDATGKIVGASKIARDITDRKRGEQAIQALNERRAAELSAMTRMQRISTRLLQTDDFAQLLDEILDAGIAITGAAMGNIQLLEGDALKLVAHRGFEPPFVEFFDRVRAGEGACGAAFEKGERVVVEDVESSVIFVDSPMLAVLRDANVRAVQSTPLVSRSGQMLGAFSTHYRMPRRPGERELRLFDVLARQLADLIERKRAGDALAASERRFRQLADSMPQMVWTALPDGQVDYYNERWYEFTGLDRNTFGDESWAAIVHPADFTLSYDTWYSSVRTGEPYNIEYRFWDRREKRWRWFMGRALPVRGESGAITKWFGTHIDIDEQKRVELELRRANQDLEQFAWSASHDLQEPLRSIRIYGELLATRYAGKLDGQALEFLEYLQAGAARMEVLVRDLLAYTQVAGFDPPDEDTDADEALTATLDGLAGAIAASGATVTREPLPPLRMRDTHLRQVFQNLIGNAIKYRHAGRPPRVHVSAACGNGSCRISVRDNGIGIDPEYKEHIFGLFKRLHTSDEYSGTGIGLAICKRIVERYSGRIWVESEPGGGSTFVFTVPL